MQGQCAGGGKEATAWKALEGEGEGGFAQRAKSERGAREWGRSVYFNIFKRKTAISVTEIIWQEIFLPRFISCCSFFFRGYTKIANMKTAKFPCLPRYIISMQSESVTFLSCIKSADHPL